MKENQGRELVKGFMTESVHEDYVREQQKIRRLGSKEKRKNRIKTEVVQVDTFEDYDDVSDTELAESSSCHIDQYLGKAIEIKVMQPSAIKSNKKIIKKAQLKNCELYSDFSKTRQKVEKRFMKEKAGKRYIQQKI